MVRYPFDTLTVLSLSTSLKTLRISKGNVEGLTMNANYVGDINIFQRILTIRFGRPVTSV